MGARLQNAAESLQERLARTPLVLTLRLRVLKGTMRIWLGPPPSDRLWFSMLGDPQFDMEVAPLVGTRAIHSAKAWAPAARHARRARHAHALLARPLAGVQGSGFRVQGSGFKVLGSGLWVRHPQRAARAPSNIITST